MEGEGGWEGWQSDMYCECCQSMYKGPGATADFIAHASELTQKPTMHYWNTAAALDNLQHCRSISTFISCVLRLDMFIFICVQPTSKFTSCFCCFCGSFSCKGISLDTTVSEGCRARVTAACQHYCGTICIPSQC